MDKNKEIKNHRLHRFSQITACCHSEGKARRISKPRFFSGVYPERREKTRFFASLRMTSEGLGMTFSKNPCLSVSRLILLFFSSVSSVVNSLFWLILKIGRCAISDLLQYLLQHHPSLPQI